MDRMEKIAQNLGCERHAVADTLFPIKKGYTLQERIRFMQAITVDNLILRPVIKCMPDCPLCSWDETDEYSCGFSDRVIESFLKNPFPEWCPLHQGDIVINKYGQ